MIEFSSCSVRPDLKLHADATDSKVMYADVLERAQRQENPLVRWMPISEHAAWLTGEICYGASAHDLAECQAFLPAGTRTLPMPWAISPVVVWRRKLDGVELLACSKTSGFGFSNSVFSASAPLEAMLSPVAIAAELECTTRLVGASVSSNGDAGAVRSALPKASLGQQAAWNQTLGDALTDMLLRLLCSGSLSLECSRGGKTQPTKALQEELRDAVLLEWASRLQQLIAPGLNLAYPAALVSPTLTSSDQNGLRMNLRWPEGCSLTMRSVRVLACKEAA